MKIIIFSFLLFTISTFSQNLQNSIKFYNSGNYKSAITGLKKVIEKDKENSKAYYYLGMCYMMLEDGDKAIENLSLSIQKDNKFADAYNSRGLAYGFVGQTEMSLEDFDRAIIVDPNFSEAYLNRATAHSSLGHIDQAISDFSEALKLDPKNPSIYYQRGQLYLSQSKNDEAISDLKQSIELGLKNSDTYFELGNSYYASKQWQNAIDSYTESLLLNPKNDKSINNRAMAYDKIGDSKKAEADRVKLEKMAGVKFTPFENIKWKTFKSSDNSISIELPSDWFFYESEKSVDRTEILITPVKWDKESATIMTSANLVMNRNMDKLFGISDPSDLINFWSSSNSKNSDSYFSYTVGSQRIKMIGDFNAKIFRTNRQVEANTIAYESYEIAAAKENVLFYGYLQSPDNQWSYYEKIFEKAIKTLKIQ